jgi:CelD/BcsL family acetyltransferase involved in cellulose biosynthesis
VERTVQQIADLFSVPRTTVYGHLDPDTTGKRPGRYCDRAWHIDDSRSSCARMTIPTMAQPEPRLAILSGAVTYGTLAELEREWLALEARSLPPPYLMFAWLKSWIEVYEPRRLRVLRVVDRDDGVVGLGLVEEMPLRRMRFAGAPVTPIRGMLCSPGRETEVWGAVARWRRYCWLGATGIELREDAIAGAVSIVLPWSSLDLPGRFDEYVGSLSSSTRRKRRRELRVAEREGAVAKMLPRESAARGIEAFVRLHQARAQTKGELHPTIDHRLLAMLVRVLSHGKPELHVNVVEWEGTTLAAEISLSDDDTWWGYNKGLDLSAAHLSPGVLLQLQSIRAAIEHGYRRYDFGPGEYAYKRYFGGKPIHRVALELTTPSAAGGVMRWVALIKHHPEQYPRLHAAAHTARAIVNGWRGAGARS